MSIQSQITRISGNVSDAFTAITNKGVTVPAGSTSDDLADLISQISGGGGGTGAISIVDTPDAAGGTVRTITAVDISSDTVTAAHLETGYTAHDAEGNPITGTLSPGGGGLEYETGTWTPTEDVDRPTINFANAHSTIPVFLMMSDTTGTTDQTSNTSYGFLYGSFKAFTGEGVPDDVTEGRRYGLAGYAYRGSANPTQGIVGITTLTGILSSAQEYWVTTTGFIPSSSSTTRYWRTGRTYKWIAVWAPTA